MEQLSAVVWGMLLVMSVLGVLGAAAMTLGADSRPSIEDSHTTTHRGDWV